MGIMPWTKGVGRSIYLFLVAYLIPLISSVDPFPCSLFTLRMRYALLRPGLGKFRTHIFILNPRQLRFPAKYFLYDYVPFIFSIFTSCQNFFFSLGKISTHIVFYLHEVKKKNGTFLSRSSSLP